MVCLKVWLIRTGDKTVQDHLTVRWFRWLCFNFIYLFVHYHRDTVKISLILLNENEKHVFVN